MSRQDQPPAQVSRTSDTDTNRVLQETWVLSPSNGTNFPSGGTNPIAVPTAGSTKFYRLAKP